MIVISDTSCISAFIQPPEVKEVLDRIERDANFFLSKGAREVILRAAGEAM